MATMTLFAMMYLAIGAALFAQPHPGTAEPHDFTWQRQREIFHDTLPNVLAWPMALWRALRS